VKVGSDAHVSTEVSNGLYNINIYIYIYIYFFDSDEGGHDKKL